MNCKICKRVYHASSDTCPHCGAVSITFEKTPRGWEWRHAGKPERLHTMISQRLVKPLALFASHQVQTHCVSAVMHKALTYPTSALKLIHENPNVFGDLTIR